MPPDWRKIREARPDLSDYLMHWTSGQRIGGTYVKPFDALKSILSYGGLKPSFAPKTSVTAGGRQETIKGSHPAVCFTEQPLGAFMKSCRALPGRYRPYGVVVHKWPLFKYGGRSVIYGDEDLLEALPDGCKYLWVRYSPIPDPIYKYPVDWTHEREWRARSGPCKYFGIGSSPSEVVPLLLPPAFYPSAKEHVLVLPRVIVKHRSEAEELKDWILDLPPYTGPNAVLRRYFSVLRNVLIIPLDDVRKHIEEGDERWSSLETLPYKELAPSLELPTPEGYL